MASGSISPFRPTSTIGLAASTTSTAVQLLGGGESVVVTNTTASLAFIKFGSDLTVVASNSDMPVLPNNRALLSINSLTSCVAAILATGSGTVLVTRGDGSTV
jgi:hypothetical protein